MKCARVIANIFTYAAELIIFAFITDMNQAENRSVSDGNRTKRRLLPCSKSDADHFFIADIYLKRHFSAYTLNMNTVDNISIPPEKFKLK